MSNIFINRNRSQGAYKVPIIKQKFLTTDELWNKRANNYRKNEFAFHANSLKYGANPDLALKHVGMPWSVVDSCDSVKLNQEQMEERWNKT